MLRWLVVTYTALSCDSWCPVHLTSFALWTLVFLQHFLYLLPCICVFIIWYRFSPSLLKMITCWRTPQELVISDAYKEVHLHLYTECPACMSGLFLQNPATQEESPFTAFAVWPTFLCLPDGYLRMHLRECQECRPCFQCWKPSCMVGVCSGKSNL